MTELPIVIVSSSWGTSLLGAIMLGLMLTAIVNWIRSGEAISAGTLAFMLCWIGVGFCFLPWAIPSQVRLEDKGIVQRAPFNFLVRDAEIAWTDIVSVEITVSHGLHTYVRSYGLAIIGKDGPVITLDPDGLPASFGPLLQRIFRERAPQAKGGGDIAESLAGMPREPLAFLVAVWIRDAHGERLR